MKTTYTTHTVDCLVWLGMCIMLYPYHPVFAVLIGVLRTVHTGVRIWGDTNRYRRMEQLHKDLAEADRILRGRA